LTALAAKASWVFVSCFSPPSTAFGLFGSLARLTTTGFPARCARDATWISAERPLDVDEAGKRSAGARSHGPRGALRVRRVVSDGCHGVAHAKIPARRRSVDRAPEKPARAAAHGAVDVEGSRPRDQISRTELSRRGGGGPARSSSRRSRAESAAGDAGRHTAAPDATAEKCRAWRAKPPGTSLIGCEGEEKSQQAEAQRPAHLCRTPLSEEQSCPEAICPCSS